MELFPQPGATKVFDLSLFMGGNSRRQVQPPVQPVWSCMELFLQSGATEVFDLFLLMGGKSRRQTALWTLGLRLGKVSGQSLTNPSSWLAL